MGNADRRLDLSQGRDSKPAAKVDSEPGSTWLVRYRASVADRLGRIESKWQQQDAAKAARRQTQKQQTIIIQRNSSMAGAFTGLFGIIFAVIGIFTIGVVFVPIAAIFSFFSLVNSLSGRSGIGFLMSAISTVLTIVGFFTSPVLMAATGLVAVHMAR
jgi:hypothetical protein